MVGLACWLCDFQKIFLFSFKTPRNGCKVVKESCSLFAWNVINIVNGGQK